ncbi:uncharacterized protein LOC135837741 isoform X2 [Planococcus citri]|uniref:uncharacterized protein LOC135837741 isoform X2 n=1 Tax=Planococcus citri TaxID=170843 RepID=UPI0031F79B45
MTTVEKCLCGCPLREGSFTIVNLDLVLKIIHMVSFFGGDNRDANGNRVEPPNFIIIILFLLYPIFGILGIIKKKPLLVWIYVVASCVVFILFGIDIIIFMIKSSSFFIYAQTDLILVKIILVVSWVFHVYCTTIVYRYNNELKNELTITSQGTAPVSTQ